jgi:hypothetical protein
MTYAQTANLSAQQGVPFVTVGIGGGFNFNANSINVSTGLASTTGGIQEAMTATTTSTNKYFGYEIIIAQSINFTTQINIPSNTAVYMNPDGGESYGTKYKLPPVVLTYTGPANATALPTPTAIAGDNRLYPVTVQNLTSNISLYGWTVQSSVSGLSGVMYITGSHAGYLENLSCMSLVAACTGLQIDGQSNPVEDFIFVSAFLCGDFGFGIGGPGNGSATPFTGDSNGHFNDSVFFGLTVEGVWNSTSSTFQAQTGNSTFTAYMCNNIQIYNLYSHTDTYTNNTGYSSSGCCQVGLISGWTGGTASPEILLYNGEHEAVLVGGNPGSFATVQVGSLMCHQGSFTVGYVYIAGGTLWLFGRMNTGGANIFFVQSSGSFYWDYAVQASAIQYTGTGGTYYPPNFNAVASGAGPYGFSSFLTNGVTCGSPRAIALGNANGPLPNPPVTATEYQNPGPSCIHIYVYCTVTTALEVQIRAIKGSSGSTSNPALITVYNSTPPVGWMGLFIVPSGATIVFTGTIADFTFQQVAIRS